MTVNVINACPTRFNIAFNRSGTTCKFPINPKNPGCKMPDFKIRHQFAHMADITETGFCIKRYAGIVNSHRAFVQAIAKLQ